MISKEMAYLVAAPKFFTMTYSSGFFCLKSNVMKSNIQLFTEEELKDFDFSEFPFNLKNVGDSYRLFNAIPRYIIGKAISWGLNDTVFTEEVFCWVIDWQFNMEVGEYYKTKIAKDYYNNDITIPFDFNKKIPK